MSSWSIAILVSNATSPRSEEVEKSYNESHMHFNTSSDSITYSGHANHELHHKSLQSCHDITNKLRVCEHRLLTGLQLQV